MYEYRKLSPEERDEMVRIRLERGYPIHAPPHPYQEGGYFLISAANFEHVSIINTPQRRTEFEVVMIQIFQSMQVYVKGWVVLPNHYHIVINIDTFERIPQALKQLHGKTSRAWNLQDSAPARKVWYRYSDRKIRNERHYYAALNYVHYNPVKHGYAASLEEWPWSSLHLYMQDFGREWLREKWNKYPVKEFGTGWDD